MEQYNFSNNYFIINKKYYRIGLLKNIDVSKIINKMDAIISNINADIIKINLEKNNPIYLIGNSARDFTEFNLFTNTQTTDKTRNLLDVKGFATNKPIPGYLYIGFNDCINENNDDDIVFHEFMHTIHKSGLDKIMGTELDYIFNKYKITNNIYNINSYGFQDVFEFFAEMAQVYCGVTTRLDVTGNVTHTILKNNLPDMYNFLKKIFKNNYSIRENICAQNCNNTFCCDCTDNNNECYNWAIKGECIKNPNYMLKNCKKSCNSCYCVPKEDNLLYKPIQALDQTLVQTPTQALEQTQIQKPIQISTQTQIKNTNYFYELLWICISCSISIIICIIIFIMIMVINTK